ncbi:MAG: hypothetical protein R6V10_02545 [bacterium]
MAEHIYPKVINGKTYYYLQKTYREKIEGSGSGKTKGSGKSRVRTKSIYLGTAQSIMERLNRAKEPVEARHREFGLFAAALPRLRMPIPFRPSKIRNKSRSKLAMDLRSIWIRGIS